MKSPNFMAILIACAAFVCSVIYPLHAARPGEEAAGVEIEKLILFKNGLGFIVSSATLPENAQLVRMGQFPVPSFGTFWVGYPKEVKVQSLVTSLEEVEQSVSVQSITQLLQLNAGRKVKVRAVDKDIEGTVLPASAPDQPLGSSPYYMNPHRMRDPVGQLPVYPRELLMIRTEKGVIALNPGSVLSAEFSDHDPAITMRSTQKIPIIRMKLDKAAGGEKVTVSYLAHGVTWAPAYLVDLSDPKTARVSAHAVIINEMTDFEHVKLQLATGYPNMRFSEIESPVAKSQSLASFLSALSGGPGRQGGNASMLMNQAALTIPSGRNDEGISTLVPGYSTATEGLVAEDLFFYPVKDFTLKKDETAWVPLFTAEMPYTHIYTWQIGDLIDETEHYRAQTELQDHKRAEEVWHSCRLLNTLSMPLTTAATEFVTNGEFTGQDVCYYTAPKAETVIRINKALNVLAEQSEVELDRKRDALVVHGYHYDAVKVRGELKIGNKIEKTITVEITKEVSGDVLESLPQAQDIKTAKGLRQVNPKHVLTWEIELTAGGEQKVSYQYQVYLRE